MKQVTYNRRRFLQTFRHVAFVLQVLCCIATHGTYVRVLDQYKLPRIFLVLPSLLIVLICINRCVTVRDRNLVSILSGAITGFINGFLSTVVIADFGTVSTARRSNLVITFSMFEFLHLPVIAGVIMYTFCLMFSRLPPLTIVILSAATSTCGAVIYTIGRTILSDYYGKGGNTTSVTDWTAPFLVFLVIFICSMMPAMNGTRRTWVLCVLGLVASIYWQSTFLDTLQWNWELSRFPIPGFVSALIVLFMIDVVDFRETDNNELPTTMRQNRRLHSSSLVESEATNDSDIITTAITWHAIAYIIERMSLTYIIERRNVTKSQPSRSDVWLCCLGMLCVVGAFSAFKDYSHLVRLTMLMLGAFLYICLTVTTTHLANGFFIDSVLGIALLTTSCLSDYVVVQ